MPDDNHLQHVIDTMALYVLDGGCAFEQAIMERGRGNPLFSFLFELGSKEHTYYVWRLYSYAQVNLLQLWSDALKCFERRPVLFTISASMAPQLITIL